jgi:hypothetical protein
VLRQIAAKRTGEPASAESSDVEFLNKDAGDEGSNDAGGARGKALLRARGAEQHLGGARSARHVATAAAGRKRVMRESFGCAL